MRARTLLPFALALFCAVFGLAREVQGAESFDTELVAALGSIPADLAANLARLRARAVSSTILEKKLREGVAKGVPQARLAQALGRMADNLVWVDTGLSACGAKAIGARTLILELGNELLLGGVARDELKPGLQLLCTASLPESAAAEVAELYFYLVNRLGAPRASSWALAREVLRRGDAKGAVAPLVTALQDIQHARGSLERPLELSLRRLRAGLSLRALKNELQEQFLSR